MNNAIKEITNLNLSKKAIAFIEGDIMNPVIGFRKDLVNALKQNGYHIYILGSYEDGRQPIDDERLIDIGSTKLSNTPWYIIKLLKALIKINPDICLTFNMRPTIYTNLLTFILRIPTISNITGIGALFESKSISYKIARILYKIALRNPLKVFFQNTTDSTEFLARKYVRQLQVCNIPGSGVKTDVFVPLPKSNNISDFTFLMVARLLKDKGIYEYVEAASKIKKKYPNTIFQVLGRLWVGKGNTDVVTQSQLENWIKDGIISQFELTNDITRFYKDSDCVVLPSYREGTANVLLEAASMERPLIATDVPGCKEIVEDGINGYICEPKSVESLVNVMEKMLLLNADERVSMGQRGRVKVVKEYDKSIVIEQYLAVINTVNKN
jgi:glycosyltransferase involved in cell wall biosynthesis